MDSMKLPDEMRVTGVKVSDSVTRWDFPQDPPIILGTGDTLHFTPKTGLIQVTRYEDALLEPENDVFV